MELRTGRIGENATDRSIRKRIQNASLQANVSRFSEENGFGMFADAVTDTSAEMAIIKAANGLAQRGVRAELVSAVLLLPVGTQEKKLREIVDELCEVCKRESMKIADVRTEVTPAVNRPVVAVTALGKVFESEKSKSRSSKEISGQSIVMTKWAGVEGTYLMSTCLADHISEKFPVAMMQRTKGLRDMLSVQREAEIAVKSAHGVSCMVKLEDGGVLAALWELSRVSGKGFTVDMTKIPILQETIEYANYLDINPYQMKSEGSLLIVAQDGDALAKELRQQGIPAAVIGEMMNSRDKVIVNGEDTRYVDLPGQDALLGLLEKTWK